MTSKTDLFFTALIGASAHKDYVSALTEWVALEKPVHTVKATRCICGTEILHTNTVRNRINHNTLIIGSCCIHKFEIESVRKETKKAYIELCCFNCTNVGERDFIKNLLKLIALKGLRCAPQYRLTLSEKEISALERLSGNKWLWRKTL